ncbi:G-box binding factor [Sparganum proliferum]
MESRPSSSKHQHPNKPAPTQLETRLVFALVSKHADILCNRWRSLVGSMLQSFRADLLSDELVGSVDSLTPGGQINLFIGHPRSLASCSNLPS